MGSKVLLEFKIGYWLNFNSANKKIFKNLSMMAYVTKIQKSRFADI